LLRLFHSWMGWNLYLSNLLAIALVTFWNFGINARFNWTGVVRSHKEGLCTPIDGETG